jgi:hypothetical protein
MDERALFVALLMQIVGDGLLQSTPAMMDLLFKYQSARPISCLYLTPTHPSARLLRWHQ